MSPESTKFYPLFSGEAPRASSVDRGSAEGRVAWWRLAPVRTLLALLIGLACTGVAPDAEAELLEVDLLSPGDGLITRDTESGLDWLDTTATVGLSYDDVVADAGGWASLGFRPATGTELCALLSAHVFAPVDNPPQETSLGTCPTDNQAATNMYDPVLYEKMKVLVGLLGPTVQPDGDIRRTDGCFDDELAPAESVGKATLFHVTDQVGTTQTSVSVRHSAAPSNFTGCGGQFMVRATAVTTTCNAPTSSVEHTIEGTLNGASYTATLCYDPSQAPSGSRSNGLDYEDYEMSLQVEGDPNVYTKDPKSYLTLFREGSFFEERLLAQFVGLGYVDFQFKAPNDGVFGAGTLPETLDGIYLNHPDSWVGYVDGVTNPKGLVTSTSSACVAACGSPPPVSCTDPPSDCDSDGVPRADDNCPETPNPDQDDLDQDGAGDLCDADDDNDGVTDADDACPETLGDTPSTSVVDDTGCTISDYCPCASAWKNHGAFQRCVAQTSEDFVHDGLIDDVTKDAIVSAAGSSACGKKGR